MNVVITGITGCLGEEIAHILLKNNYNVIGTYCNNQKKADELSKKINIEIYELDLNNENSIKEFIKKIQNKKIDILINNAAYYNDSPLNEKTSKEFLKILNINLVGPFILSKEIGKLMLENKKGKIINIASTNGIDTYYPESIDYDASKAGLINLTKNLASYFAPYITVNAIAPGWIETKETLNMNEEFIKEEKDKILLKRFAKPEEIAQLVLFLCQNNYINSETIRIDGGIK